MLSIMGLQVKRKKAARTFPPPAAAVPARGRRKQILEKAAVLEKAEEKKRAASERRRIKAEAKKRAQRLATRRAAVKAVMRPLVIARDGVKEFAKALYKVTLALYRGGLKRISHGARTCRAAGASTARGARGMIAKLDPRSALAFLGKAVAAFWGWAGGALRRIAARTKATATNLAGRVASGVKTIAALPQKLSPLTHAPHLAKWIVAVAERAAQAARDALRRTAAWLKDLPRLFEPRRLLTYSYATAIGVSLVIVGGQIALRLAAGPGGDGDGNGAPHYAAGEDGAGETAAALALLRDPKPSFEAQSLPRIKQARRRQEKSVAAAGEGDRDEPPAGNGNRTAGETGEARQARSAIAIPRSKPAPVYPQAPGKPSIAIVIDDMGMVQRSNSRFARLPAEVTFAFLPYSPNLDRQTRLIREAGHELIVHLPMEPKRRTADPGPKALLTGLSNAELHARIVWNLERFKGFKGINNHMGSRFTEDPRVMRAVMSELKSRNLYFLDSMTTSQSVGIPMAAEAGVPRAPRDIFLDNKREYGAILRQLRKAEKIAGRRGHVIAIGHPYRITYQVLRDWVPSLRRRGLQLVPLSALVARQAPEIRIAGANPESDGAAQPERATSSSSAAGLR